MPSVKRKTEEPLVETASPEGEARAEQLAQSWQLSEAPRDLWPELEKLLPTAIDDVIEAAKQAQRLGLPFVDLVAYAPEPTALACLSGELAQKHRAVPMRKDGNRLFVAMENPRDIQAIDAIRIHSHLMVQPLVAAPSQLEIALEEFYPETAPSGDRGALPPIPPIAVGASSSDEDPDDYPSFAAFLEDRGGPRNVAPLTARQEKWLARCIERGGAQGERAREILVNANLRLVTAIAKKYENRGIPMEDLIQEGVLGLIYAADRYDYRRGFRFSTYATHWVRQAIGRAVEGEGRMVRLPEHAVASLEKIKQLRAQLQTELGRATTPIELAVATDLPELDAETRLEDLLPSEEELAQPSPRVFRQALRREIDRALERLTERERKVLTLRYGLAEDQSEPKTLEQVGEALQLSRERTRQIEAGALQKLRRQQETDLEPASPTPVNGEQTDFATFQKVYERRVYRRAAALCGDTDAAQTLTLDVFTHAWRVWNDLPPGTRNWAWLTALTDRLHAESQRALPIDLSPLMAELRAIRGELAGLREENAVLRREIAGLRRTERSTNYFTTLMPYAPDDDRALLLH